MSACSHDRAGTKPSPACSIPDAATILDLSTDTIRRYMLMAGENVNLAVLGERLSNALNLLSEVREEQRIQGRKLNSVEAIGERVSALERWQTWALRTVVGLVIIAGVAATAAFYAPG